MGQKRLRRDLRALQVCAGVLVVAAVSLLFSHRVSYVLILGVGVGYLAYRAVDVVLHRFRREHPVRMIILVVLALSVAFSLLGVGRHPFIIFLLLALDCMMVLRLSAAGRKGSK